MKDIELTCEIFNELLKCNSEKGELICKIREVRWFNGNERVKNWWNTKYAGKPACNVKHINGYREGCILKKAYKAHRLIWFYATGEWPDKIDHINGNREDNRLINLRDVSNQENSKNQKLRKTNTTGVMGVYLRKNGTFQASIYVNNRIKCLGTYKTLEKAAFVRKQAEIKYGFHENHGRIE